jgi:hypothetical protein
VLSVQKRYKQESWFSQSVELSEVVGESVSLVGGLLRFSRCDLLLGEAGI